MEKVSEKIKTTKIIEWMKSNIGKRIMGTILLGMLGIALPRVFHMMSGATVGATFLPMHIAVLIATVSFGIVSGSVVTGISVISSYLITGMPSAEKLPWMLIELLIYVLVLGLLNKKFNSYISLIGAIIFGRLIYAGILLFSENVLEFHLRNITNVWQATITGIYGIIIQIACIPFIAKTIKKGAKLEE